MCDFKPGDEVVCVKYLDDAGEREGMPPIGHVDIVRFVGRAIWGPEWGLLLEGHRAPGDLGMNVLCFRKVQRRDLSAWLKTSIGNTGKLDKRHRSPAKERA